MNPNKNYLLAMFLSFAVILGWQYFYVQPQNEAYKKAHFAAIQNNYKLSQNITNNEVNYTPNDRAIAIANNNRVAIDTPEFTGSINVNGAIFDDLLLKNYHQTVRKDSPQIALLTPNGTKNSYLAKFDFLSSANTNLDLPNSTTLWQISSENKVLSSQNPIKLSYQSKNGLLFERLISVDNKFMFNIEDKITNNSSTPITLQPYSQVTRSDIPKNSKATYLLHEGPIGVMGAQGLKEKSYEDIKKLDYDANGEKKIKFDNAVGGFVGITDKYWAVTAIPDQNVNFTSNFKYVENANMHFHANMLEQNFTIAPQQSLTINNRLFAGAKHVQTINAYQDKLHIKQFGLLIDWGLFSLITKPMFFLLDYLYKLTGNFGIAILLVTVILKVLLFPLAHKSYASMAKMRLLQPQISTLKERYKDDQQKLQKATIELYKKEKINPAAGCLPLFIQMPIFFALYKVLYITIEMRHAPFFGWIQDLAAPDPTSIFNLFGLLPYNVPHFLMVGAWPIIMGITMFLQARLNPAPQDPIQAKIFAWMPLIFTFMLSSFPVGLVIYWAWNNILTIIQQLIIMKKQDKNA